MKGRLEMGWRLLKLLGSFLSIGVTAAVLKSVGTIPVAREECMMADMKGSRGAVGRRGSN